jgi:PAS domain S-box-containing protein
MSERPTYEELEQRIQELEQAEFKRKRTEKALMESEARYRELFASIPQPMWVYDLESLAFLDVNNAAISHYGYSREEFLSMTLKDICLAEDVPRLPDNVDHVSDGLDKAGIWCHIRKDGNVIEVEITSHVLQFCQRPAEMVLVCDITERRRAGESLKKSDRRYRTLFEKTTDAIFIVERSTGRYLDANAAAIRLSGRRLSELKQMTTKDVTPDGYSERLGIIAKSNKAKELGKVIYLRPDGTHRVAILTTVPLDSEEIIGIARDVTDELAMEDRLRQAQKMEAIGTLAGGIAHDFNNLLMGIQGRTSLMLTDSDSSHPYFEHLQGIEDYVKSAADLTKQLLGFARGGKYEVKTTDLNNLITNQNRMFGRTRKEITIRGKYEEDLWTAEVDQGQIQQVLLNLYINAWQAMPGGGDLYIQTQNVNLDENYTMPFKTSPGKYVKVSVTDTGVGMDEVTRQRIFDPFFTTKEKGRGTGLGLASVYGIVKNHGGFIDVYSEKGGGATFNIYLPATEKETVKKKELEKDVLKGSETVLLVDDEDMIIDVGKPMLEKMGYNVLIARSGKEALELIQKNEQTIGMVILDLIMPDISGGDTYDKLKEINPEIKVMLASGYSIDGQTSEILERGCNGFIQKPFNIKKLSQKIREILDKD